MKKLFLILNAMLLTIGINAQIVTTSPTPLQENSANVVLTFHAEQGTGGLKGLSPSEAVYAHIGVITNKSTSGSDWKYAPTWLDNSSKYKCTYVAANTYTLTIGDIRTYFGITDATEHVKQIAVVFRNSTGTKEGKATGGLDIFVDVLEDGFNMSFVSDADGDILSSSTNTVNFTVGTTQAAKIELFINNTTTPVKTVASGTTLTYSHTFAVGFHTITARATSGSDVIEKVMTLLYPSASTAATYPGGVPKMGPVVNSDGSVTFCLAAPKKTNALIIGSWDDYKAKTTSVMNYQDYQGNRYFWKTVSGLENNKDYVYYFVVDQSIKVGDPYARLVLDPWNDQWIPAANNNSIIPYPRDKVTGNVMLCVFNKNQDNYNWKVTNFQIPNKNDLIIYELLLRDFTGTEGKAEGNGSLALAMEKVEYLRELGVNAVELMPIQEFSGNNSWGYNPNFYFAPDKEYGTPAQYRAFIDLCHQNGIAVILDVVLNQSDGLHPWYQLYGGVQNNPFYNAVAPHDYSVLNDWNQDNALVDQQWKDMLQFWLTKYNVDGFRFDLVKGLGDNNSYGSGTEAYNQSRINRMKKLHGYMTAVKPGCIFINENLASASEENQMANDGELCWANVNYNSNEYAVGNQSDLRRFNATNDSRNFASTVSYAESHDEQRNAYCMTTCTNTYIKSSHQVRMRRLSSLAAQMILNPGAHMIFQFGELGDEQSEKTSSGNNVDPKIVKWNNFSDTYRKALYKCYSEINWFRRSNADLFSQSASFTNNCDYNSWSGGRTIYAYSGNKEMVLVVNPLPATSSKMINATFKSSNKSDYHVVSCSQGVSSTAFSPSTGQVQLPGNSYILIANNNCAGVEGVVSDARNNVSVFGGNGEIVVFGDYKNAAVYNLSGQRMSMNNLRSGIYVVVVDGKATKVLVK